MNPSKQLVWGETPFDHMSHEELVIHSKRMFMALTSADNELNMMREMSIQQQPQHPYWNGGGKGNEAFQRVEQALAKASDGYSSEDIYRSYFRYAPNLFFDVWPGSKMDNWVICGGCGALMGVESEHMKKYTGVKHADAPEPNENCQGVFRRLTTDDLKPTE